MRIKFYSNITSSAAFLYCCILYIPLTFSRDVCDADDGSLSVNKKIFYSTLFNDEFEVKGMERRTIADVNVRYIIRDSG